MQDLILGTAQLTDAYGITRDTTHRSSNSLEAQLILQEAANLGFGAIDTAPVYGLAESAVGASNWSGPIWTKLDPKVSPRESVFNSLSCLRRSKIDVLFIHDIQHLLNMSPGELAELLNLRGTIVSKLGISVYAVSEIFEAAAIMDFEVIQFPCNVFDTRFEVAFQAGQLPDGLTLVARSALLQGALGDPLTAASRLPPPISEQLLQWLAVCREIGVSPAEAALKWVLSRTFVNAVVLGAQNSRQLKQISEWTMSASVYDDLSIIQPLNLWPHSDPRTWHASNW